jgi:two-component system phosphate regulon response regulator PhoB
MIAAAKPLVLVAGENSFAGLLAYIAQQEGFLSLFTDDLDEVISLAESKRPDLIALDDCPARGSALAVREKIHANPQLCQVPVMILLADTAEAEARDTLHLERTDYLLKPFSPDQFMARLHQLIRPSGGRDVLGFGDLVMELDAHRVYRGKRSIHLSRVEYLLLKHLLGRPRCVFSREELLAAVWGVDIHVIARTVDVHMSRIRKALTECGEPNCIRTVRGTGYSLDTEEDGTVPQGSRNLQPLAPAFTTSDLGYPRDDVSLQPVSCPMPGDTQAAEER